MLRPTLITIVAVSAARPAHAQAECPYPAPRQPADPPPALTDYPGSYRLILVRTTNPQDTVIGRLALHLRVPSFRPIILWDRCSSSDELCTPQADTSETAFPLVGSADFATLRLPFHASRSPGSRSVDTPGVIAKLGNDAWLEMWIGGTHGAPEGLPGPFAVVNRQADGFRGYWRDGENEFSRTAGHFCAVRTD
jgi:hypothetical protein